MRKYSHVIPAQAGIQFVIASAARQSSQEQVVIASEARQSSGVRWLYASGLPRRSAPRSDGGGKEDGLGMTCKPQTLRQP